MSSGPASHAGISSRSRKRSSTPAPFSMVTGLKPRADHDATKPSTHAAWNASALSSLATAAVAPVITRRPGFTMPTFFLPHEVKVAPNDRAHRLEDQG